MREWLNKKKNGKLTLLVVVQRPASSVFQTLAFLARLKLRVIDDVLRQFYAADVQFGFSVNHVRLRYPSDTNTMIGQLFNVRCPANNI